LVSERLDWRDMFVAPGYARACDPTDPVSIAAVLTWFVDHPAERRAMGARGRAQIEAEGDYGSAFPPVIWPLSRGLQRLRVTSFPCDDLVWDGVTLQCPKRLQRSHGPRFITEIFPPV